MTTWLAVVASLVLSACVTPGGGERAGAQPFSTSSAPVHGEQGAMPDVSVTTLQRARVASTNAPVDVWDRVRRGFAIPELEHELVARHEQWYSQRPDYIERMVARSRLYIFHIVEELELRGMPTELALLPYIESAFNPQAISSARAAGIWQFMPATGRDFSLRQNILRDERLDVIRSTRAALDYLQMLHNMFGDWHLALAAYNWGQGNLQNAIRRNQAAGLPTDYVSLSMPQETRNYVPKLQAVKNIIANPQAYGTALPIIANHPFFDQVSIQHDMDVDVAARLADVRLEDFRALNPSLHKPVIFAAAAQHILLPWDNAEVFRRNLAATPKDKLSTWTAWVAPSAMPAREVASRFSMNEDDFHRMNGLPRGVVIQQGSTVLVHRTQGQGPASAQAVANATLNYRPEVVLRRTTVRARAGDTLASIAARYDLPAATLVGWNKGSANAKLRPGTQVQLYLPARTSVARNGVSAPSRAANASPSKASAAPGRAGTRASAKVATGRAAPAAAKAPTRAGKTRAVAAKTPAKTTAKAPAKPAAKSSAKAVAKPATRSAAKSAAKPAAKPATKSSTAAKPKKPR